MADPKIKYDIEANVSGNADVGQLASRIEQLADTLDGELKTSALASADALRQLAQKDGAIRNFVDLKREAGQAATGLRDAQAAAQKLGTELSAIATPTRAQAGQLQKLRDAVRDAKTEVVAKNAALVQARGGLDKYGISTNNLSQSQRNIKTAIQAARTEVQGMAPAWQSAAAGATASAGKQVQASRQIESGLDKLKGQLSSLRNIAVAALGGSYVGSLAKDLAATADAYKNLQARIKLVTGEGAAFESAFEGVTAVAQRTSSALESTGNLFAKLAQAGQAMGVGQAEALALTETVNQAVQLSGASAQASDAAITQLIQGLQGGVLRGDEFNSVMEQSPRLARALADGLGTTTGELRKMAEAGQLSSNVVIKALQGQSDAVATEFAKLPPTVGRAIENLSTSWTLYVGETDKAMGASSAAASAINALSDNLSTVAGFLLDAGQAAAALAAIRLAQYFLGVGTAAATATTAVVANTAAVTAAGAAGSTAAVGVGRFASILSSLKLFSLIGIVTNFHDIGTAIGEAAAKLMGYKDRSDEIAASDRVSAQIAADTIAMRQRMAAATQLAIDKQFELGVAGRGAITEFDKLTKSGDSAAEAIGKIGKDFDLANVPGIQNATAVLDKLVADGKLSAHEFQEAWGNALKGVDLAVFETQAKAAFAGTAREAERLAQVLDASLREAIRRTGLDFEVISGGMGKASQSAINDTEAIIAGLERLQLMGVDTAQALTASIGKGIDMADTQQALETVRAQIEAVRKVLGDKIADGLLDQAAEKAKKLKEELEKATPGINSVAEAMKKLGVVSDETLKNTAAQSKKAFDEMRNSGTASARELSEGFKKYAADAIAANGGVASEALKAEAAMYGMEIQVDKTGKAIVRSMKDGADATREAKRAAQELIEEYRKVAGEAYKATSEIGKLIMAKRNAAVDDGQFLVAGELTREAQREDNLDANEKARAKQREKNNAPVTTPTQRSVFENAKGQGLTEAQALQISNQFIQNGRQVATGGTRLDGSNWGTDLQKAIDALVLQNASAKAGTDLRGVSNTPAKTYTVNVNMGGKQTSINTSSDADAQALIALLQRAKLSS